MPGGGPEGPRSGIVRESMPRGGGMGGAMPGMPGGGMPSGSMAPSDAATTATQLFSQNQAELLRSPTDDFAEPTGFASLDVEIPTDTSKYDVFLFTTPRGDLTITARPISRFLTTRLTGIAWLAGILALAWVLTRRGVRNAGRILARSPFTGLALIALGIAALISHVLPMAGLLIGLVGICQLTSWLVARGTARRIAA